VRTGTDQRLVAGDPVDDDVQERSDGEAEEADDAEQHGRTSLASVSVSDRRVISRR
jgi:hypothetical protein